jgi:hypothetical protein
MRTLPVTLLAAAALAAPVAAVAAARPAVPVFIQKLAQAKAGPVAYAPTRLPFRYAYRRYRWAPATHRLTYWFADTRYPANGKHSIAVTAEPFGGTLASCADGKQKTLQLDGNKVYWDGSVAWRCVTGANGKLVKILASGPNLPDSALGIVAASVKRI